MQRFYLGIHQPHWLERMPVPAFVARQRLAARKTLPRARRPWALDSGGFNELRAFGGWRLSPRTYASQVVRFARDVGQLEWASVQDWMCEADALRATGLSVLEHQRRTLQNYAELLDLAPDLPWAPVLQGWCPGDYEEHLEMYLRANLPIDRASIVGVGTVCRRSWGGLGTIRLAETLTYIAKTAKLPLHAFGLSMNAFHAHPELLEAFVSSDSMAWSFAARKRGTPKDRNSLSYALGWYAEFAEMVGLGIHVPAAAHATSNPQLHLF